MNLPKPAIRNIRNPKENFKQSYMMKGADINFIITLAEYLEESQSEALHLLIKAARRNNRIFQDVADMLEERAKDVRKIQINDLEENPQKDS